MAKLRLVQTPQVRRETSGRFALSKLQSHLAKIHKRALREGGRVEGYAIVLTVRGPDRKLWVEWANCADDSLYLASALAQMELDLRGDLATIVDEHGKEGA